MKPWWGIYTTDIGKSYRSGVSTLLLPSRELVVKYLPAHDWQRKNSFLRFNICEVAGRVHDPESAGETSVPIVPN